MRSESDISPEFLPPARFPSIHVEMLRIERGNGHGCIRLNGLVGSDVFRTQLKPAVFAVTRRRQTFDGQARVRQYLIVDDVIEKHCFRIERLRRQNYAIIKAFVITDGSIPNGTPSKTLNWREPNRCETTHNFVIYIIFYYFSECYSSNQAQKNRARARFFRFATEQRPAIPRPLPRPVFL